MVDILNWKLMILFRIKIKVKLMFGVMASNERCESHE